MAATNTPKRRHAGAVSPDYIDAMFERELETLKEAIKKLPGLKSGE